MEQTVYNPQKGRLETINVDFTDENTLYCVCRPVAVSTFLVKFINSNCR
jgi:hypothetical protein